MKLKYVAMAAFAAAGLAVCGPIGAQSTKEEFRARYELLMKNLGPEGVGMETLLNRWEKAFPDDQDMLIAKFGYYFSRSQTTRVEKMDRDRYLGAEPILPMKDSLGNKANFFQVTDYDDALYRTAADALDKAISLAPENLDYRFLKVNSLIAYEKESPDMALSELKALADYNALNKPSWTYPEAKVDADFFNTAMQEYCYSFFRLGTPGGFEAFRELSEKMLAYNPSNTVFLTNLGTYSLVAAHDNKAAMKYYNKVLKLKKGDYTALKNIILLARNSKDTKLEKKYLPQLIEATEDETEKTSYKLRLESLNAKK